MESQKRNTELDEVLDCGLTPSEIGDELDETLNDLVQYSGKYEVYYQELPNRYFVVRMLRNMFWKLAKEKP